MLELERLKMHIMNQVFPKFNQTTKTIWLPFTTAWHRVME